MFDDVIFGFTLKKGGDDDDSDKSDDSEDEDDANVRPKTTGLLT